MANDSATGGYLTVSAGLSREALENALQAWIVGLTELPAPMVRPRFQAKPPKQPRHDVNWCAFGVTANQPEGAQLVQGEDAARLDQWELLTGLASFYGPDGEDLARTLLVRAQVPQNRVMLRAAGLVLVECGQRVRVPELIGETWLDRHDLPMTLRRGPVAGEGAVAIRTITSAPTEIERS